MYCDIVHYDRGQYQRCAVPEINDGRLPPERSQRRYFGICHYPLHATDLPYPLAPGTSSLHALSGSPPVVRVVEDAGTY